MVELFQQSNCLHEELVQRTKARQFHFHQLVKHLEEFQILSMQPMHLHHRELHNQFFDVRHHPVKYFKFNTQFSCLLRIAKLFLPMQHNSSYEISQLFLVTILLHVMICQHKLAHLQLHFHQQMLLLENLHRLVPKIHHLMMLLQSFLQVIRGSNFQLLPWDEN